VNTVLRFFVLLLLAAFAGCKKEQPPPPPPEAKPTPYAAPKAGSHQTEEDADFWAWVKAHLDELKAVKTGQEPVTQGLTLALENIAPGLVFELGIGVDASSFELTISADGKKDLFPVVQRLVAAAPPLPGTKVIAFRPRKQIQDFGMKVGEGRIAGSELYFVASNDPERKGLVAVDVFVKDMKREDDEALKNAAFMLLEAAVGEYDLETKIGTIDIKPAPAKIEAPLKPLKDLPATLDAWK
jgi:hypothetical protein